MDKNWNIKLKKEIENYLIKLHDFKNKWSMDNPQNKQFIDAIKSKYDSGIVAQKSAISRSRDFCKNLLNQSFGQNNFVNQEFVNQENVDKNGEINQKEQTQYAIFNQGFNEGDKIIIKKLLDMIKHEKQILDSGKDITRFADNEQKAVLNQWLGDYFSILLNDTNDENYEKFPTLVILLELLGADYDVSIMSNTEFCGTYDSLAEVNKLNEKYSKICQESFNKFVCDLYNDKQGVEEKVSYVFEKDLLPFNFQKYYDFCGKEMGFKISFDKFDENSEIDSSPNKNPKHTYNSKYEKLIDDAIACDDELTQINPIKNHYPISKKFLNEISEELGKSSYSSLMDFAQHLMEMYGMEVSQEFLKFKENNFECSAEEILIADQRYYAEKEAEARAFARMEEAEEREQARREEMERQREYERQRRKEELERQEEEKLRHERELFEQIQFRENQARLQEKQIEMQKMQAIAQYDTKISELQLELSKSQLSSGSHDMSRIRELESQIRDLEYKKNDVRRRR